MFSKLKFTQNLYNTKTPTSTLLEEANKILENLTKNKLSHLDILDYKYDPNLAVEELGIDYDLVMQLLDDYVSQTIKSIVQFEAHMKTLQQLQNEDLFLDYQPFRDLAHKNLGVARNLRIKDAEILLYELMKKDDLNYLILCLEALKACSIRLSPQCAFDTLKLIEVKNSLLNNY